MAKMAKQDFKLAIGLMSGTSMDGIDAALIESDGDHHVRVLSTISHSYFDIFKAKLKSSLEAAQTIQHRLERPHDLSYIERDLTLAHVKIVKALLDKIKISAQNIDVIGFHGQTILHRPKQGLTVQLGDGALLAQQTGINVVYDMRANDMVHNGQGAPLVPIYHAALAVKKQKSVKFPVAFVNIGGIANLTLIKTPNLNAPSNIMAFDCGPGNVLIDQWVNFRGGHAFDKDGALGLAGAVNENLLKYILLGDVFKQNTAQSLDWKNFKPLMDMSISLQDGAATLAFLTARQIYHSFKFLDEIPKQLIVSGGGAKNKAIMKYLKLLTKANHISIINADEIGLNSTFIEAEAWGYLAIRSLKNMPLTYPQTTGCTMPVTGGVFASFKNI